jgi:hypothetical protein
MTLRLAFALLLAAGTLSPLAGVHARGGGPANIINSEGYQRALREERKLYQQPQASTQTAVPATSPRHRHRKHKH